jgi:flagellar motor switch protein FliN
MIDSTTPIPEAKAYLQVANEVGHFLDVPMNLVIYLGQRFMKVREILQLTKDSIVDLPKSAGENVDVFVNGKLVACGEVLEIEGKAGVRLTDVLPDV